MLHRFPQCPIQVGYISIRGHLKDKYMRQRGDVQSRRQKSNGSKTRLTILGRNPFGCEALSGYVGTVIQLEDKAGL